jgi:hypothetical protein
MMDLDLRRRFFAEEIEAVCKLRSSALVDAFATVARERFLRPGPWTVLAESDFLAGSGMTRLTPDADPARIYHNIVVAIDPARQLFNGQPGTIAVWLDALDLTGPIDHSGWQARAQTSALPASRCGPSASIVPRARLTSFVRTKARNDMGCTRPVASPGRPPPPPHAVGWLMSGMGSGTADVAPAVPVQLGSDGRRCGPSLPSFLAITSA